MDKPARDHQGPQVALLGGDGVDAKHLKAIKSALEALYVLRLDYVLLIEATGHPSTACRALPEQVLGHPRPQQQHADDALATAR